MKNDRAKIWNKEYSAESKLLTKSKEPQAFIRRLFKFLKKQNIDFSRFNILDLGTGNGRNLIYFSQFGSCGVGIDISDVAIDMAKKLGAQNKNVQFIVGNIGKAFYFDSDVFDLVIDATSSNALSEKERATYLGEVKRVLKPGGYFFVRALCKDGDKNAKKLLQTFPGKEKDTYIMPGVNLQEKVFSREDFVKTYLDFEILELKKDSSYSKVGNQSYKRNFWLSVMKKV